MARRPTYHRASECRRNLILSMSGAASSTAMRLEDQFTEALAWILDRDPSTALRLARRYVERDGQALSALESVDRLGVSTQVRLPPLVPDSDHLRPDLSLTVPDRRFQLLVEVKVTADLGVGTYPTESGGRLDQVAAYVESWRSKTNPDDEAVIRRVGTLTARGDVPPRGEWRAADLRWEDVAELLATEPVAPPVAAVAADLEDLVAAMFRRVDPPAGYLKAGSALVRDLVVHLAGMLASPATGRPTASRPHFDTGYAGGYLSFMTPAGDREHMWIVVTATGSQYAEPGAPPSLWLCFTNDAPPQLATRRALEPFGFRDVVDRAGYRSFRVGFPLRASRLAEELDQVRPQVRAWARGLLADAGFERGPGD